MNREGSPPKRATHTPSSRTKALLWLQLIVGLCGIAYGTVIVVSNVALPLGLVVGAARLLLPEGSGFSGQPARRKRHDATRCQRMY